MKITVGDVEALLRDGKKVKVKTLGGQFSEITDFIDKGVQSTYKVTTESDYSIKVTAAHRFFTDVGWMTTKLLIPNQTSLLTEDGYKTVKSVNYIGKYPIVDISVDHPEQCYYGNGILNHNSGKSYMAAQIGANAQKMGLCVVYFDSENAIDPEFWDRIGLNVDEVIYDQPDCVEDVFEKIETLLGIEGMRYLFIWDSLANTPTRGMLEEGYSPTESVGLKARVLSKSFSKLTLPLGRADSAFLVLNQLKTNITKDRWEALREPFVTPGGKSMEYTASLRIWLTMKRTKDFSIFDENGFKIGSEVKVILKKSRFGTEGRQLGFKITFAGDTIGIKDEESWLEAIRRSEHVTLGQNDYLFYADGTKEAFRKKTNWLKKLQQPKFRERVLELMEEEVILKFENRTGKASDFYNLESEDAEDVS